MGPVRLATYSCFVLLLPMIVCDMDNWYEDIAEVQDCEQSFCSIVTLPPPPPIPQFMRSMLNDSLTSDGDCNLCRLFGVAEGPRYQLPRPSDKSSSSPASDGMTSVVVACVMGLCFGGLLLALIWCKKWRHTSSKSSCFSCTFFSPGGVFGGQRKGAPPPPSPTQSVISPVVNEKSPQSIIMDHGTNGKKSVIQTKYWRRGSDFTIDASSSVLHPHRSHSDHYGGDGATGSSCTSSPVYAELDGVPVGAHGPGSSLLITCPGSSISPYAVGMNTYSELPDNSMRMVNIGSSAALLPDSSYDNAAYLPNLNPNQEQFGSRSLRRPRTGLSGQPLLHSSGSHHQFNAQVVTSAPVTHLTVGTRKKSRQQQHTLAQQLARSSVQRMQEIDQIDDLSGDRTSAGAAARFTGRRSSAQSASQTFVDAGMHSPSMTTFKSASPYASYSDRTNRSDRDSKRPLPPVPGIRL